MGLIQIEKARADIDMKENISEEVITGKSKLSDRVAFWTRQSSIKNKVQETGSDVKEEPIFRRQGSVRDLARQFGSNRNSIELNQKVKIQIQIIHHFKETHLFVNHG